MGKVITIAFMNTLYKTHFSIPQMDCPSEENLIRMKLQPIEGIVRLEFDLPGRQLSVFHKGEVREIDKALLILGLGAKLVSSQETQELPLNSSDSTDRRLLWAVLGINFGFFVVEMLAGWLAHSMGLLADSLDMLADAVVYGLSLLAIGHLASRKRKVAQLSGYFQLLLALFGFVEVVRRFAGVEEMVDYPTMIGVSFFALLGNLACLYLLNKSSNKDREVHLQASWIFTSNDVLANLGVIAAGVLVVVTHSNLPDLVIGTLIFALVSRGAYRILQLAKA